MTADRILAIDVGTQSVRAMVFDPAGNLLARTKVPIEPYVPGPPGCCEQDPELYWRSIAELNGIDDPQRVHAGMTVLIPSRADAAKAR